MTITSGALATVSLSSRIRAHVCDTLDVLLDLRFEPHNAMRREAQALRERSSSFHPQEGAIGELYAKPLEVCPGE